MKTRPTAKPSGFIGTTELARHASVSSMTAVRWCQRGVIKASRVPGIKSRWRIPRDEAKRFLAEIGVTLRP